MKICCWLLLLPLLQSFVVFAHNNYNSRTERHVKKPVSNSTLHKLRKRENRCPPDEYLGETHCCKLCNAGTYAKSDCSVIDGYPECSDCIAGQNYMDAKNGLHSCHKCLQCDHEQGQEMLQACTVFKNTVCKCAENFFCTEKRTDKSDGCMHCEHCTQCEHGIAQACTATNNTVCIFPRQRLHYAVLPPLGAILILVCCMSWALCKTNTKEHTPSDPQPPRPIPEVPDIDLEDHLQAFADKMNLNTVLWVVRTMGLPDTYIDIIQHDCVNQSNEQKVHLLKAWYVKHGRIGAFQKLIRTLQQNDKPLIAEWLIEIIKDQG